MKHDDEGQPDLRVTRAMVWRDVDESVWSTSEDPTPMLVFLRDRASERKLRLFAVACCRRIWDRLPDQGRQAVEEAERFADGLAGRKELASARRACRPRDYLDRPLPERDGAWFAMLAALCCVSDNELDLEGATMASAMAHAGYSLADAPEGSTRYAQRKRARARECSHQASLLREVFGNPFRPISFAPGTVPPAIRSLADSIYAERAFERIPVLRESLDEAGCKSEEVLGHAHRSGGHVRGCWLIDALLGRT